MRKQDRDLKESHKLERFLSQVGKIETLEDVLGLVGRTPGSLGSNLAFALRNGFTSAQDHRERIAYDALLERLKAKGWTWEPRKGEEPLLVNRLTGRVVSIE